MGDPLQKMSSIKLQLNEWNEYLHCLQSNDFDNYLKQKLYAIKSSIESQQEYYKDLQTKRDILLHEINALQNELSSINPHQPNYENIKRIANENQLKLLSISSSFTSPSTHFLIGQIVKKKKLSQITFLELLISHHFLIKIALKKTDFCYSDLQKNCKMGAIIECFGQIEDENADKLVLILDKIQIIQAYKAKGFEPLKMTNKNKSAKILCSHFIKHFVSSSKYTDSMHLRSVIYNEFVPKICKKSNCFYRHRVVSKNECNKIIKEFELRQRRMIQEFDKNDP